MSSSDSEDDCYGNATKKLQSLLKNYSEDKIDSVNLLKDSTTSMQNVIESTSTTNINRTNDNVETILISGQDDSLYEDDVILDQIIALNSVTQTRSRSKRGAEPKHRGRGSKRGRGKNSIPKENITTVNNLEAVPSETTNYFEHLAASISGSCRGSSRARSRRGRNRQSLGSEPNRSRRRNVQSRSPIYPTYSVGNTEEYEDTSDDVQLFSSKLNSCTSPSQEEDPLDDNEELSVKVYWRSSEVVKFTIRRFQKISQIFDFFANRDNVTINNLLLTYNDKILKPDDTPDKIGYNIAKFIDGGIVTSVPTAVEYDVDDENGIKLKFQCQNVKKPFIVCVQKDEKLLKAMIKCAEHLDKQFNTLKFVFDGDAISGGMTPEDLDLEGGECIDVKIK